MVFTVNTASLLSIYGGGSASVCLLHPSPGACDDGDDDGDGARASSRAWARGWPPPPSRSSLCPPQSRVPRVQT